MLLPYDSTSRLQIPICLTKTLNVCVRPSDPYSSIKSAIPEECLGTHCACYYGTASLIEIFCGFNSAAHRPRRATWMRSAISNTCRGTRLDRLVASEGNFEILEIVRCHCPGRSTRTQDPFCEFTFHFVFLLKNLNTSGIAPAMIVP